MWLEGVSYSSEGKLFVFVGPKPADAGARKVGVAAELPPLPPPPTRF